ncbi:CHAD domain-containing protein [Chelativorans sp. AA-79]|uniref:CHAD domain-containing protein n=1 Tax=Chelativorans sp. AA-79 TaxID=3028735 RepID=UPI0023F7B205|nr:CHAD domain-containing protein [Chelativorans sp. AA-79]WEX09378.1 CHAD domain-containing protein [Chelativorans sp. AA-79]
MSYRIEKDRPLDSEIRRIAAEEIDAVATRLANAPKDRQETLHDARKRLKRLRGLIKLVRRADPAFHDRENTRYRDLARELAPMRDADTLVETADRFLAAASDSQAAVHVAAIRDYLVSRRDRIVREHQEVAFPAALAALAEGRQALASLALLREPRAAARLLARGAEDVVTKARKALRRARKHGKADDFHELRKAMKNHRMHMDLLKKLQPVGTGRRRKADALADRLGELNDIDVMLTFLQREEEGIAAPEAIRAFRELLAAEEKALRKACLRQAEGLFEKEGKLARRIEQGIRKAA